MGCGASSEDPVYREPPQPGYQGYPAQGPGPGYYPPAAGYQPPPPPPAAAQPPPGDMSQTRNTSRGSSAVPQQAPPPAGPPPYPAYAPAPPPGYGGYGYAPPPPPQVIYQQAPQQDHSTRNALLGAGAGFLGGALVADMFDSDGGLF